MSMTHEQLRKKKMAILASLLLPFDWAYAISAPPYASSCYPQFNKIKLQSTTGQVINMFEFQVLSQGINIATNGTAIQSSTRKQAIASKAIDDNPTTHSSTAALDPSGWWEINFDATVTADTISIMNRWCVDNTDPNGCLCWLSDATLSVEDEHGELVFADSTGDTCGVLELRFDLPHLCTETLTPSSSPSMMPSAQPSVSLAPTSSSPTFIPSRSPTIVPVTATPSTLVCSVSAKKVKVESTTRQIINMFEMQLEWR